MIIHLYSIYLYFLYISICFIIFTVSLLHFATYSHNFLTYLVSLKPKSNKSEKAGIILFLFDIKDKIHE